MVGLVMALAATTYPIFLRPGEMLRGSVLIFRAVWPLSTVSGSIISSNVWSRLVVTPLPGLEVTTLSAIGDGKMAHCLTSTMANS